MSASATPQEGENLAARGSFGRLSARQPSTRRLKRCIDVCIASVCLVILSPIVLLTAVAILASSRGPVLFRQQRVGMHQQEFVMLKFRTMRAGASDAAHRVYVETLLRGEAAAVDGLYKLGQDLRITRVGAILRKLSIDELPQLINVLRGDMSLVGPRPALPWEAELFPEWSRSRFLVPPGITGLWQVSGRNRLTMLDGLVLDVDYVKQHTIRLDAWILLRTVPALLRGGAR